MNILFLSPNYAPIIGGAEAYASDLCRGLVRRGHRVVVITSARDADSAGVQYDEGVQVVRQWVATEDPSKTDWERRIFGTLHEMARAIDGFQIDVVHTNSQDAAVTGAIIAAEKGVPLISTTHEIGRHRTALGQGRCRFVFGLSAIDAHIAPSRFYERQLELFGARNIRRIYLGIDTDQFQYFAGDTRPEDSSEDRAEFLISCPARFKERKGQVELLQAFREARRTDSRLKLMLCGSTSSASATYEKGLRELVTVMGLNEHVHITDSVTRDQMPQLLAGTDLVVLPSYEEGLGLAVVEAMACGVPVAVSSIPGLDEVVPNSAFGELFEPGDVAGMTNAILRLSLDRARRAEVVSAALARVTTLFSLERMLSETEQLYMDVMEGARNGTR